jgi:hypothetical protein
MRSIIEHGDRYDQNVMMSIVDIMATDPDADATAAMLEILPEILESAVSTGPGQGLTPEFREYFYTALVTRQRDDDLNVWGEVLPTLEPRTLVAALIDPAAIPLLAIEPLTLIDRLKEPTRTAALISVIVGVARAQGSHQHVQQATEMLARSCDEAKLDEGLNTLQAQWERAKKAGQPYHAALEMALRTLDKRPRTAGERLTGKRPWAP